MGEYSVVSQASAAENWERELGVGNLSPPLPLVKLFYLRLVLVKFYMVWAQELGYGSEITGPDSIYQPGIKWPAYY